MLKMNTQAQLNNRQQLDDGIFVKLKKRIENVSIRWTDEKETTKKEILTTSIYSIDVELIRS